MIYFLIVCFMYLTSLPQSCAENVFGLCLLYVCTGCLTLYCIVFVNAMRIY